MLVSDIQLSKGGKARKVVTQQRAFPIPVVIQTLEYTAILAALKPLCCRNMTDASPPWKEGDLNSEPASWVGLGPC